MNERLHEMILELAEIAEEYSYVEYAKKQTGYSRQYFYNQKFAELIVRECLEQVRDEVQYEYDWKLADAVSTRVLEHFGVEP